MGYTFLETVFVLLLMIVRDFRYIFCAEHLLIDLRNDMPKVISSDFTYDERVITDEQIKLFKMDGKNAIDAWKKEYPNDRPECVVLKGPCNGEDLYKSQGWRETKVAVVLDDNVKVNFLKEINHVRCLAQIYTNNSTSNEVKLTLPRNNVTLFTQFTRTHGKETTKAWSLEAGTAKISVLTKSGFFEFESKWSENSIEIKPISVEIGNMSEITLRPGETIQSFIAYKETPFTVELTYHMMTISQGQIVAGKGTYHVAGTNYVLSAIGYPTKYSHTIKLHFAVVSEVFHVIEKFNGV